MNDIGTRRKLPLVLVAAAALVAVFLFSPAALAGWWCAPGAGSCDLTNEECAGHHKGQQCSEYPDVFRLDAKMRMPSAYLPLSRQVSDGWTFPLLVQCEAKRKEVERDSNYRSVGRCRSQRAVEAEMVERLAKYAKSVGSCQCATAERIREMLGVISARAGQQALIIHRHVTADAGDPPGAADDALNRELDANDKTMWEALEQGGYWDVSLAMGLSMPFTPPKPETTPPDHDPKREFEKARGFLAKDNINSGSLSDQDIRNLKWATSHGEDPKARSIVKTAVENMKAVEVTVGREGFARSLAWAEEYLTDPRARCIVELLDRQRKRTKADLAKMDSLARRRR
jgi:hypothetical protein